MLYVDIDKRIDLLMSRLGEKPEESDVALLASKADLAWQADEGILVFAKTGGEITQEEFDEMICSLLTDYNAAFEDKTENIVKAMRNAEAEAEACAAERNRRADREIRPQR